MNAEALYLYERKRNLNIKYQKIVCQESTQIP